MPWHDGQAHGSFKKILISEEYLRVEASLLAEQIQGLYEQINANDLSSASICFQFILIYLKSRVGKKAFLKMGTILPEETNEIEFVREVRFFGIPDTVRNALYRWMLGEWNIELVDYLPSSKEMFYAQSQGYRLTSIAWEESIKGEFVEGKRDAFEHLLHDLAHGYMFFRADYDHMGQVIFFQSMYKDFDNFSSYLESDIVFKQKFEYCISDMNSHPAHLQAYWNAIRREAGISVPKENNT